MAGSIPTRNRGAKSVLLRLGGWPEDELHRRAAIDALSVNGGGNELSRPGFDDPYGRSVQRIYESGQSSARRLIGQSYQGIYLPGRRRPHL
jgi:hypothetical protein